jgi:hypothetical protein
MIQLPAIWLAGSGGSNRELSVLQKNSPWIPTAVPTLLNITSLPLCKPSFAALGELAYSAAFLL